LPPELFADLKERFMLTYMRKRSKSWITKVIFGAIIVVFVFWGGSSYFAREANKIAKVDRYIISLQQYSKAYSDALKTYQRQFGDAFTPEMIETLDLKNQVLDQLINDYVLRIEASKMGVTVSDEELQQAIQQVPAFLDNGKFNVENYKRLLAYERLTPQEFEEQQRKALFQQRVYSMITENIIVAQQEIEASFKHKNDTFDLYYIDVDSKQFAQDISVSDDEISPYYNNNKEQYKIPPKIRLSYLEFPTDTYLEDTDVTTEEAGEYYDTHNGEFTSEAKVHARHILIRISPDAEETEVNQKQELAQKIYDDINAGQDFASLAKEYSEDPGTNFIGGDIGLVPKDSLPKPMGDTLYSMKPGEIKGPIRTYLGFHVLKLEAKQEEKLSEFEEVSSSIIDMLKKQRAKIIARDTAYSTFTELYEQGEMDLEAYAEVKGLKVKEIGPVAEDENIGLARGDEILKEAFLLPAGEIGNYVDIESGYIVYMVKEKISSRIPEMDEIRDRLANDISSEMALEKTKEHAENLIIKDINELVGLDAKSTGEFKRTAYAIPKLGMTEGIRDDLDSLSTPRVYTRNGRVLVVWIKVKNEADISSADKEQLDQIKEELLSRKRRMAIDSFIEQSREKHDIIIDKDKLT
jgi:peptidyl-prolyl cis-trans isomerase D